MNVDANDLIQVLQTQRNAALNEAALLSVRVKALEKKIRAMNSAIEVAPTTTTTE